MIPIFTANKTRNPHSYNGLTLNQEVGGSEKDIIAVESVRTQTTIEAVTERREFSDGLEVYTAYKRAKRILLDGEVRGSSYAALYDRMEELASAFDPALISHDNADDQGFLAYDFNVPTTDTTTYPTGLMACRYYARPEQTVEPAIINGPIAAYFQIVLLCADPRRYLQSTESLAGAGTADNTKADYMSWPTLTIAMSGAGSSAFKITNSTVDTSGLTLDLSGMADSDSVSVDMETQTIKKNGVATPELYVSGDYFWIEPGSNTIAVTNDTNASPTLTWRPAFSF